MTREKAKPLVPIVQAWAEGKTVQIRGLSPETNWIDASDSDVSMIFEIGLVEWRIKPEPRRFWLVCRKDSPRLPWGVWTNEPTEKEAYDIIPVIEVLK